MRLPWDPMTGPERRLLRRDRKLNGLHAVAIKGPLAQAREFALAEDLPSARNARGDAEALAQERGRGQYGGGLVGSS